MWNPFKAMANLITELRNNTTATAANTAALADSAAALADNTATNRQLLSALGLMTVEVDELNVKLAKLLDRLRDLPDPGPISLSVYLEDGSMLVFKINLPALPDPPGDIVSGELTVTIGGASPVVIPTTSGQAVVDELRGNQGDSVTASFAWVDDAGNRSVHPSSIDGLVLNDTIPPPDPGALSLEVTREE